MGSVLVGDIGGTHARFALFDPVSAGFVAPPSTLLCSGYAGLEALVEAYLQGCPPERRPDAVAIAVAGPVSEGAAKFTNLPWRVSEAGLRRAAFAQALVINDYEALALAAPAITAADRTRIGPAVPPYRGTIAVLGPGTGFGAAAYCVDACGSAVLVTEGGHIGFSPSDEVELQVWRVMAARFGGRVSLERILSGPGLLNLHDALGEIEGGATHLATPADLLAAAQAGHPGASATVQRFCSILGAAAGDFALAYGAVGGVLLAGGIPPRLIEVLRGGGFRSAFERKGRFEAYLAIISTDVITQPYLALLGAAQGLRRRSTGS